MDSVARHPPSLHGVARVASPASAVLWGCSDATSPFSPPSAFHLGRRYRPFDGDDVASQVPGVPLLTCPALRPRWDSRTLTLRMTVGVGLHCFRRLSPSCRCRSPLRSHYPGASRCAHAAFRLAYDVGSHTCAFRGSITRPVRSLSTLRGFPSSTLESYSHARLASGWWSTFAGRDFHPSGTTERFQNSSTFHSPFPGLAWRKCKRVTHWFWLAPEQTATEHTTNCATSSTGPVSTS